MISHKRRGRPTLHYGISKLEEIPHKIRNRPLDPDNPHRGAWSLVAFGPLVGQSKETWQVRQLGSSHNLCGDLQYTAAVFVLLTSPRYNFVKWSNVNDIIIRSRCSNCSRFIGYKLRECEELCTECTRIIARCSNCGAQESRSRVVKYGGRTLCIACINSMYRICQICNILMEPQSDHVYSIPGQSRGEMVIICLGCRDRYVVTCLNCGSQMFGPARLCQNCQAEAKRLTPIDPQNTPYTLVPRELSYSVEVELSAFTCRHKLEQDFKIVQDSSVSGDAIEIRCGVMWGDRGLERLKYLFTLLEDHDAAADKSCGGHIHIGGLSIDKESTRKLIFESYRAIEPFIYRLVPKARRSSRYSKGLPKTYKECVELRDRYTWLNLASYLKHRTLEIRLGPGFTKFERCSQWLLLHLTLFNHIITTEKVISPPRTIETFCKWLTKLGLNGEYWMKRATIYDEQD